MSSLAARVDAVRRFTRFYTLYAGVLHRRLLNSAFSLTEARVIYELAHHETATAAELAGELNLDSGYLSRILKGFEKQGLIARRPSENDGRASLLSLTEAGEAAFAELNARSRAETAAKLERLSEAEQGEVVEAMERIQARLNAKTPRKVPYILRPHRPGDMGWIVHRHAVLYSEEWGWDETFEALVARIAADFLDNFDAKGEHCWIAEMEGEVVGSTFVVRQSDKVAKLRLVYVEPKARGLGIGARMVDEAIRFARRRGYRTLTLWTNDVLVAARRIYEAAGFKLVKEEKHHSFGQDLVGQYWELDLR
ncbi:bifunctional helix-turn-helix transcriptional regulator/GNAT family N-acetyltransferase [Pelagibius marinus]|uniref:bifunctional helix-turn-helix transcriptional regulator/GNAT family N-acetyltransferase n=1 Tax=Pelagibius marinus TaxID=2762760 RepID=UPI0018732B50|nr:bifunctional helix-turn-helix transcriptional regulator/GNAT family N-acetyltransferase [Pelagibius marinus]